MQHRLPQPPVDYVPVHVQRCFNEDAYLSMAIPGTPEASEIDPKSQTRLVRVMSVLLGQFKQLSRPYAQDLVHNMLHGHQYEHSLDDTP